MFNKRGQDLSIGTLILIVLGIVVLVLLILGFSLGWSNLWEKVGIFQGGSGVESVIQSCKIAASTDALFTYCSDFKQIKVDGKTEYLNCQDGKVVLGGLDKELTCTKTTAELIAIQCGELSEADQKNSNVLVNSKPCVAESDGHYKTKELLDAAVTAATTATTEA